MFDPKNFFKTLLCQKNKKNPNLFLFLLYSHQREKSVIHKGPIFSTLQNQGRPQCRYVGKHEHYDDSSNISHDLLMMNTYLPTFPVAKAGWIPPCRWGGSCRESPSHTHPSEVAPVASVPADWLGSAPIF